MYEDTAAIRVILPRKSSLLTIWQYARVSDSTRLVMSCTDSVIDQTEDEVVVTYLTSVKVAVELV